MNRSSTPYPPDAPLAIVEPRDAAFAPLPDHSSASDVCYGSDGSKYTLQVALQALVTEASATSMITPNVRKAGIVIAILPLMLRSPLAGISADPCRRRTGSCSLGSVPQEPIHRWFCLSRCAGAGEGSKQ